MSFCVSSLFVIMSREREMQYLEFINIYQSKVCMWKIKSKEYHDRQKEAAYSRMVEKLKEIDSSATGQENQQLKKQLPQGIEKSERVNKVRNRCR